MHRFARYAKQVVNPFYWFRKLYSLLYSAKFKSCGSGFSAAHPLKVKGRENIKIGNNFSSMGYNYLYANDGGELIIGDNFSVNTNVQIGAAGGKITIGNNVMIGPNVVIRAANHGLNRESPMRLQPHKYGEILIEDDVWIGSNVVITSDVVLAIGTVVGAGAVVIKSTKPYSVVGGVPAKKIVERV